MVGSSGRWVVAVGVAAALVALALLGRRFDTTVDVEVHDTGESVVVDAAAPVVAGGGASGDAAVRGLARVVRPVALPVDDEAVLAGVVATALLVGGWVLLRGDGWGVRPVVASPLAARRGPPR